MYQASDFKVCCPCSHFQRHTIIVAVLLLSLRGARLARRRLLLPGGNVAVHVSDSEATAAGASKLPTVRGKGGAAYLAAAGCAASVALLAAAAPGP